MGEKNYLRELLRHCETAGHTMICSYDGEVDYEGTSAAEAEEALTACDEMSLTIRDRWGKRVGWALIIPGLAPDEVIADYSGERLGNWMEKHGL